jgi:hypothetical protein
MQDTTTTHEYYIRLTDQAPASLRLAPNHAYEAFTTNTGPGVCVAVKTTHSYRFVDLHTGEYEILSERDVS